MVHASGRFGFAGVCARFPDGESPAIDMGQAYGTGKCTGKTVGGRSNGFLYAVNDFVPQQLSYVSALISANKYHPTR